MDQNSESTQWQQRCPTLLNAAAEEVRRLHHCYLGIEHLFIALTQSSEGESLLNSVGLNASEIRDAIRREAGNGKSAAVGFPALTPRLQNVLNRASQDAATEATLSEKELLRAIFEEGESLPVRYLASLDHEPAAFLLRLSSTGIPMSANMTQLAGGLTSLEGTLLSTGSSAKLNPPPEIRPSSVPGSRIEPEAKVPVSMPTPTLDQWGRDLSKLARLGKLADAIGRESEILQVITILARTQKSNPLLLGEAGVGKTAIVEGLAWRIAQGKVQPVLRGKRIVEIDMGGLTAGTSLRGQFEERIKQVINEATNTPEVILFIDEIHTIVGAGKGEGASDAAQIFKPALARGDISCVGATTQDEYSQYIRKDAALERRFSPVTVKELTPEATMEVLQKVAPRILEKQAGQGQYLNLAPDALRVAVLLTDKYIKDRHQPDKAIDAIDIACASAIVSGKSSVSAEDIARVVSEWSGIPAERLSSDEQKRYAQMEATIGKRVIGQDTALKAVSRSLRAALAGMKEPNRPIGVFFFMGPSGVGKTQLAKELARFLFNTPDALIRFDMSEYQEKHTVSNLIGAARGYIGSEQGGLLTEALRRKPYSVVLLDEIEKAHPDVFNIFLSVFDDGRITDNFGRVVDCSNAVFILSSNIDIIKEKKIGFSASESSNLRAEVAQFLRPELVNRITDIIRFEPLGRHELTCILEIILAEKTQRLRSTQNINLKADESAKDLILRTGFDPHMGARPLERAVEQMIIQPLVDAIFAGQIAPGDIHVTAQDDKIVFTSMTAGE
jgi:ATP-dependent Clp protease ATP-binding subunit ClpC